VGVVHECPFCPENGKVEVVAEVEAAYLCEVKNGPLPECYFIIPKQHMESIELLPDDWQRQMNRLLRQIPWWFAGADFNISINVGRKAGQRVKHLHFWVIPREDESPASPAYELGPATAIAKLHGLA